MSGRRETSVPWQLYEHHFKHQPVCATSPLSNMQSKESAQSLKMSARYKNKIVFLHVFVHDDTTVPTMGTNLSILLFSKTADKLETSTENCLCRMSERADLFKEKGKKIEWTKWEPHSQDSSYSQGHLGRGRSVKVSNVIPIPDLLRQTLGQVVSVLNITLQSPILDNIRSSGHHWL